MKTKNYLPPLAYRIGAIASVLQVGIALAVAVTTDPAHRPTHLGAAALHVGLLVFWLQMHKKALRYVPAEPPKALTVSAAQWFLRLAVLFAIAFEVMMLWLGYQSYQIGAGIDSFRLRLGTMLTVISMQVNPLMIGGIMIVVARQHLEQAKRAALKPKTIAEESVVAPARSGWWTQDETRQELRRK